MDERELDRRFTVIVMLWGALLGGVVLFGGVAWALASGLLTGTPWTPVLEPAMALPFLGLAVILMVGGIVFRRAGEGAPGASPTLEAYQTRAVAVWAVQEGSGLMGVMLSLMAGRPSWILTMAGLSAFALLLTRPGRDELDRLFRG